jgi:uncharacterized membrane protein
MKRAKDFRESAWNILRGRYWWAVLAGLIASILGGVGSTASFNYNYRFDSTNISQQLQSWSGIQIDPDQLLAIMRPFAGILAALGGLIFVYSIAMFIIGSAVELGYNRFNLTLYESTSAPKIETLFSRFSAFGNALVLRLLMVLKTLAWTLLFVVPGIVAAYRYRMAPYIMAENPDISATEAIEQSKQRMSGNKSRLFYLDLSFIGWYLLAALTGGIGYVFLTPYVKAASTAFYLDLTGRLPSSPISATAAPVAPDSPAASAAPTLSEDEASSKELV